MLQRIETTILILLIFLAPGLWDAAEYSIGTHGKKMHKYHNHPDLRPDVAWEDWTVLDSFITGIQVSWFLVLPTLLLVSIIYLNKKSILSHLESSIVFRLKDRALRWIRFYTILFTGIPFLIYLGYSNFVEHPFKNIPLEDVTQQSIQQIDGNLLFVHLLYYIHGGVFAVIGLFLAVLVHGRPTDTSSNQGA